MEENKGMCFVIMPISDPSGYDEGHFASIYRDIFRPAIESAGYEPHRVDEDSSSGLIQAKIIENLIQAPMAVCDLSTRNPNVLFELGIRQAFDKPVVLVQEKGTERIFDINGISCLDYDPRLLYSEVLKSQDCIRRAILETESKPRYNSLIKLLKLSSAKMPEEGLSKNEMNEVMLNSIMGAVRELKKELSDVKQCYFLADKRETQEARDTAATPEERAEREAIQNKLWKTYMVTQQTLKSLPPLDEKQMKILKDAIKQAKEINQFIPTPDE